MLKKSFSVTSISLIMFFFLFPFILEDSIEQSVPVNISNTKGESKNVQILVDDNDVFTVWVDNSPGNSEIFFSKSNNGGNSFDKPINLSLNNGSSAFPRLAISENNLYIVWYDYSPGQSDVFFAKSTNRGDSFDVKNISQTPMPSYNPWIGAWKNYVYLVFNDGGRTATMELPGGETRVVDVNTGDEELILMRSDNYGETFEFVNLSHSLGITSWNARINVLEDNVFVNWNERLTNQGDIFFTKSTDNGNTFSNPINLSDNPLNSVDSIIAGFENNIYIVWNDSNQNTTDIFFVKSNDNGNSFGERINLSNSSTKSILTRDGALAVYGDKIFVVWYDESELENYIYFTRSIDGGLTFSSPIDLSPDNAISKYAQVVTHENNVYVLWNDYSKGNGDIFLRESKDGGATFGSIRNLSNNEQESRLFILGPQIALTDNKIFAVWENRDDEGGDLFITSFSHDKSKPQYPLHLSTLNEAVKVEVEINQDQLDIIEPSNFTLKFFDPLNDSLLEEVNYSIEILDSKDHEVTNMPNLFAKSGVDTLSITFQNSGTFQLLIDIKGTGTEIPYNTKNSGVLSVIFTVVPEFPLGVILSLGLGLGIIITLRRTSLFHPKI